MEDYKSVIFQYVFYISLLFIVLYVATELFYKKPVESSNNYVTSKIESKDDKSTIYVEYPRFKEDKINEIVTNILYSYIKDFKKETKNKVLDMSYRVYYFDNYVNITFHIENTLNNIKNKNILIDLSTKSLAYISNIYSEETLKNEINDLVYYKYSSDIYDKVKNSNINNFTYLLDDNKMEVYFNNIEFEDIDYIPYITMEYTKNTSNNDNNIEEKKYISFTYDDGPSEYTGEILKTLELNNSSATFFMIGNNIKDNEQTLLEIYNSKSEIGSHGYSHKDLTAINTKEFNEEINSFNLLFKEITNDKVKYLRPAYGRYNKQVLSLNTKVVLWNIDPKDWLLKDSDKIYNSVINDACDGCIVLMHDIYPETLEATKKLLPELKEMGYEVVSISKLIELKGYKYNKEEPISYIK